MENKKSKFADKFKKFIKIKGSGVKISKLRPKVALDIFQKFTHKNEKFKTTALGDVHKGRGVSNFQDKFSLSKAVSTIAAPTFAAKSIVKGVAKEGAKFSVAIFDNSPGFVKSWVRSFSGYGLALHAAHERFDSLPEVVKIKARRSLFEIFLVFIILLAFGLGFGIYYGIHKPARTVTVQTSPDPEESTTWKNNASFVDPAFGSFTWTLNVNGFLNFNSNYSDLKDFYINNFYGSDSKYGSDSFFFTGVDVPSLGVSLIDVDAQNNQSPKLAHAYVAPPAFTNSYQHYAPSTGGLKTPRAHFVKYTNSGQINQVIRSTIGTNKQATNPSDDLYRDNLLEPFGHPGSRFALYTLSQYVQATKQYKPETINFVSTDRNAPRIQENVSIVVTNNDPGTRQPGQNSANYNVQIILTDPLGTQDSKSASYITNFGGVVFINQTYTGPLSGNQYFSQNLQFTTK